jgi:hypothetical protein
MFCVYTVAVAVESIETILLTLIYKWLIHRTDSTLHRVASRDRRPCCSNGTIQDSVLCPSSPSLDARHQQASTRPSQSPKTQRIKNQNAKGLDMAGGAPSSIKDSGRGKGTARQSGKKRKGLAFFVPCMRCSRRCFAAIPADPGLGPHHRSISLRGDGQSWIPSSSSEWHQRGFSMSRPIQTSVREVGPRRNEGLDLGACGSSRGSYDAG